METITMVIIVCAVFAIDAALAALCLRAAYMNRKEQPDMPELGIPFWRFVKYTKFAEDYPFLPQKMFRGFRLDYCIMSNRRVDKCVDPNVEYNVDMDSFIIETILKKGYDCQYHGWCKNPSALLLRCDSLSEIGDYYNELKSGINRWSVENHEKTVKDSEKIEKEEVIEI